MDLPRFARFRWQHEASLVVLIAALLATAAWLMPGFVDVRSQWYLSRHLWETAILGLGMTMIIVSGGIDLSVGSAMGMCAVAFGMIHAATHSVPLSCLGCVTAGVLGGALNGALVARWHVHPLIVTLATYAGFRGIAEGVSQGESYSQFGERFATLARGSWFGAPIAAYLFATLAVVFALVLHGSAWGQYVRAMGHSERAARYSGVPVDRIRFWLYTTSGLLAGLATLVYVARFDTAKADAGFGIELDVITAVVIGGTSIQGGRGTIGGTVLGLLLIHETRLFVGRYWRIDELRPIVVGIVLIAAVLLYRALKARWSAQPVPDADRSG